MKITTTDNKQLARLYVGSAPLPDGSELLGTVTTTDGTSGALLRTASGKTVRYNNGTISAIDNRGGARPGSGRPRGTKRESSANRRRHRKQTTLNDAELRAILVAIAGQNITISEFLRSSSLMCAAKVLGRRNAESQYFEV